MKRIQMGLVWKRSMHVSAIALDVESWWRLWGIIKGLPELFIIANS